MSKVHRAYYRKKNHIHVYAGFIVGDEWQDELGNRWYDFTTEHGSHFGAVPAEEVTIGESLTLGGKVRA